MVEAIVRYNSLSPGIKKEVTQYAAGTPFPFWFPVMSAQAISHILPDAAADAVLGSQPETVQE